MIADDIPRNRLYDDLSEYWPLISPPAEYADEAAAWRHILIEKLGPGCHHLLELGVGGGHNLSHLTGDFKATAVDLSDKMLALSRKLNPTVEHIQGDMRNIRLGRTFDAVVIHDAVNYMLSTDDLRAAFATAAAHLPRGGLLITSPDHTTETFVDGKLGDSTHSDGLTTLTFVEYQYDPDPTDTTVESIMLYVIRQGGRVRLEHDRHITGLFPLQTWMDIIAEAGFTAEKRDYPEHPDWFGDLIGVKR